MSQFYQIGPPTERVLRTGMRTSLLVLWLALGCASSSSESTEVAPAPVGDTTGAENAAPSDPAPVADLAAPAGPEWDDARDPNETPVDVAAVPPYAETTPSGLASHVLRHGTGTVHPESTTSVTVNYAGWTLDGNLFDSSWQRGQPATFPLNRVIAGWTEGVQLMVEGEIRRFWIPAELAYGNEAMGNRPSGMLVFDVELISL